MAEKQQRPRDGQKIALITGAGAGGIGGALATELHKKGYFVFCAVRRPATAEALLQPGMAIVQMDVTSTESVNTAAEQVSAIAGGRLDVLVNNAGIATHRPALDLDIDGVAQDTLNINVLGPMRAVQAFSDMLIKAKGCVVNIGSIAPIMPLAYSSIYNASKAALHAYSEALRMELKPFGVDVVAVVTGGVQSNIIREDQPSLPKTSRYLPVEKFWLSRVTQSQKGAMPTDEYARKVVAMIQKKNRPIRYWCGAFVTTAWILFHFAPRALRLLLMSRRYGLNLLRR